MGGACDASIQLKLVVGGASDNRAAGGETPALLDRI